MRISAGVTPYGKAQLSCVPAQGVEIIRPTKSSSVPKKRQGAELKVPHRRYNMIRIQRTLRP